MTHRLRKIMLLGSLTALAAAGSIVMAQAAAADTTICERYGSTTVGQYVVQNNRWGTDATHCITVTNSGFRISQQDGSSTTGPVSYPSMFLGCHYTNCSPGTNLPKQLSTISAVSSSISFNFVSNAVYNAAYDIWLDPTAKKDGVNQTEIMIWFHQQGSIQPIGSPVGNTNLGGRSWQVWTGNNGGNNVVSYVASSSLSSWSFDMMPFINDTKNRGYANNSWYLTSIQAGFEPWRGGVGLAVNSFSASVTGGSTPPTTGPTTDPTTGPTTGPSGACRVAYQTSTWSSGFTADVSVTNTGSTPVNGWSLAFTLPSGQTITSAWNATLAGSSGSITAKNVAYNGNIPANGSQSFGFQGTYSGSFGRPSSFTLNGTTCSLA